MILEVIEYIGIAFAGAFMLIIFSKFIMPAFMKKNTNYYDVHGNESVNACEDVEKQFFDDYTQTSTAGERNVHR